ncbi:MAG: bifunctional phosphopantothenoylcysteine decarboxylase/phosphopantothenate--cysteine ligase CoaBC [Pegethrix bostrychoides GSE-TBD4-15B]|jgi:phosphopantothenoylcysteine decarboxylase/phosphopantothenate--cysteine ligase|uniref:Coenzyme A biosynthesis bifunctional protein CoaBC n=1 Tax=Pegethrix bostrychoides GSE-TBD4-15B TaxID=2839662 RepID=A0A951U521_9CYAN|nr:bifunctional phosphopantothenoylcysteine decarboxylase/phosphopantothenate--cysteine ligase CoaBC [Pegethrix bostrychoides GSE-TBD4-15B]
MLQGRRVLIGVGGGIAAYKVCQVISTLAKLGVEVRTVSTDNAQQFITPLTLATLSRHPVYTDDLFWQPSQYRPLHIELGEWAELMLIAPLTANLMAKLTHGLADNLLTSTVLASTSPILLAPAMNTDMWQQPSVQRNWQVLQTDLRYHAVSPGTGMLACDRVGMGRMAEPSEILTYLHSLLYTQGKRDLVGKHLLISAGGTREHLDPVRFIGNPSTGKMGVALAQAASHRGAKVTLVHAPMEPRLLSGLSGVRLLPVVSALEMRQAVLSSFSEADWIIMAAAVADVRPKEYYREKLPKRLLPDQLPLSVAPDILSELSQQKRSQQRLIGFAAQTGDIFTPAFEKLQRKKLDAIVANAIDQVDSGFGSDQNQAIFLDHEGRKVAIGQCSKLQMSHHLFDFIHTMSGRNY